MIKQVIIIRKDLGMRRGKECSQAAHAAMAFMINRARKTGGWTPTATETKWLTEGQTKITLQISSEEEMMQIYNSAIDSGIPAHVITDAGRTEFAGVATKTCLALGPAEAEEIDKLTGNLKLY